MKSIQSFLKLALLALILPGFSLRGAETSVNFSGSGTIVVDDVVMFYDDGGPSGKYTTNTYGSMTFVAPEGKSLRMKFLSFYTHDEDHLLVYDGTKASGKPIADMSGYYYDDQMPDLISESQPGALTVVFDPEKNKKYAGWEIRIEAFSAAQLAVDNVEVIPVHDIRMLRGSVNNRMLRAKVTVAGDMGKVDINALKFSALESCIDAITNAKVWFTGEDENFATYSLYGETAPAEEMTFAGSCTLDKASEVYFWLTYDIAEDAVTDSKIQAGSVSIVTDGTTIETDSESTPALTTVQDGMHGTYSVGTSGAYDFASITEAVTALTAGIDGAVTLELADGNYRELVNVPAITGASEKNTITIRSAGGNAEKVVITFDTYTNPRSSNYDKRYGVFTFDGVNYLTLQDVTVTSGTYTGFPGIVYLRNASRHCAVKNCIITAPTSTDLAYGTSLVYMYTGNVANSNCDYFTLENCELDGGLIGVTLAGTSSAKYDKQKGGCIVGNNITNQGSKGIYVSYERNATVSGNTIIMGTELTSSYYALDLSAFEGDLEVSANRVVMDKPRQSAVGMYIRTYSSDASKYGRLRVYNNSFNLLDVSSAVTGIRINNDIPMLELVHNTVNIEPAKGENPYAVGVFFGGSIKGGRMVNNIIRNLTNGYGMQINREEYAANSGIVFSNNLLYAANAAGLVYLGGTGPNAGMNDFDKWMTLGYDSHSFSENVEFEGVDCLKPVAEGNLRSGVPIDFVTTDILGNERHAETPTVGAYELGSTSSVGAGEFADAPSLEVVGNTLYATGLRRGCVLDIYTIQGQKVVSAKVTTETVAVDLSSLTHGIYIVGVKDSATVKTLKLML